MAAEMRFLEAALNLRLPRLVPLLWSAPTERRPMPADQLRTAMALSRRSFWLTTPQEFLEYP